MASADAPSIASGLRCRCPRCGRGKLFRGFLKVAPSCEACGLDFAFADAGDGPAFFIISIVGAVVVAAALWVEVTYEPPMWVHVVTWPLVTAVLCLGSLRPLKGVMVAAQYANKAEQGRFR